METHEYVYRMKPLVVPGLGYLILYPLIIGAIAYFLSLDQIYVTLFVGIYIVTAVVIFGTWIAAKSSKILIDNDTIVFCSLKGKTVLKPKDIRRASFIWTKKNDEIVILKAGKKVYYLSALYFPFNELLSDLEELITNNNIRSNLSSHYGI